MHYYVNHNYIVRNIVKLWLRSEITTFFSQSIRASYESEGI